MGPEAGGAGLAVNNAVLTLWIVSAINLALWAWAFYSSIKAGRLPAGKSTTLSAEGNPADLESGLAKVLSAGGGGADPVRLKKVSEGCLEVSSVTGARLRRIPCFDECGVLIKPAGPGQLKVVLNFNYMTVKSRTMLILKVLLAVSLVLIAGLAAVLGLTVTGSPSAAIRGQAIQAVHAVHFIWPCWLVAGIYRRAREAADTYMESAVANASVLAGAYARSRRVSEP